MWETLNDKKKDAIVNAKKLKDYHQEQGNKTPCKQNPYTEIGTLIEDMIKYLP